MAVILPWHDPLRVAEQVSVLDCLCKGRLRLGIGRGLARREFEVFRGTMDESRERFDEASDMMSRSTSLGWACPVVAWMNEPSSAGLPLPCGFDRVCSVWGDSGRL